MLKKFKFELKGLDCPNCARKIEDKLKQNNKLKNVVISFASLTLSFESDEEINIQKDIINIVKIIEPNVQVIDLYNNVEEKETKIDKDIIFVSIGIVLALLAFVVENNVCYALLIFWSYLVLMYKTLLTAIKKLKNRIIDESALICS